MTEPPRIGRRRLLQTGAAAVGGAGLGWSASAVVAEQVPRGTTSGTVDDAVVVSPAPGNEIVAFHGPHQAGVSTPPQAFVSLLGLDLREDIDAAGLARLMRLLSDDASRLAVGRPALADTEPELAAKPSRLSVTFGFGPRVVTDLVPPGRGLRLGPLPGFATDRLEPAWGQTDLAIQVCADDQVTVAHARRMLLKDARTFASVRWIQDGFRRAHGSEPEGTTMRNLMGQVDGTVNPAAAEPDFASLVWGTADTTSSADGAFSGGTFMVVRRIRARMDSWDKVSREGKEFAVGRRLDNGAPLTGTREHDDPDFDATDDHGFPVIDLAAHMRRARTDDPGQRFLRRAYNYTVPDTTQSTGEDSGLVFVAFAHDIGRQFVPIQQRLADQDRLNQWVTTIGSAVYAVPPGSTESDYVGRTLLT